MAEMSVTDKIQTDMFKARADENLRKLRVVQAKGKLTRLKDSYTRLLSTINKQEQLIRRLENG